MKDWPREIRKTRVYGNFRTESKKAARQSWQKRRENNNEAHLALIRQLPCCIPGCRAGPPNDPHHLRSGPAASERAFGRRATDRRAVPCCRDHHDGVHYLPPSKEINYFKEMGLDDVTALAEALWQAPRSVAAMRILVMEHRGES